MANKNESSSSETTKNTVGTSTGSYTISKPPYMSGLTDYESQKVLNREAGWTDTQGREYFNLPADEFNKLSGQSPNQETSGVDGNVEDLVVTGTRKQPAVSFNIDNFRAEIGSSGTLPTHSFLVRFAPFSGDSSLNNVLTNYTTINKDKLIMRCDNAILPGVNLIKEEAIRRYGYGPTETVPYNVNFGDFTLQWIVDNNSEVIDFFNRWINVIVNHNSKGGADMSSPNGELNAYEPYEVGFKDDYSNRIVSVFVYDRSLNTTIEYSIYDVFPISIQSINLAWGDENQMMKYNVTFAFTDMVMKTPMAGNSLSYVSQQGTTVMSPNEERQNPNDIIVTANRNRQTGSPSLFDGATMTLGNYTAATPPDARLLIDPPVSAMPTIPGLNIITIPSLF